MKLFTHYNRLYLPIMIFLFVLSGVIYYGWINYILTRELNEELSEQQERISQYIQKKNVLPPKELLEEWRVIYSRAEKFLPGHTFSTEERYDEEERATMSFQKISFMARVQDQVYSVTISRPLEALHSLAKTIALTTISLLLLIILVSILLNHFVLRKLWRPFYGTLDSLKKFKLGNPNKIILAETSITEFAFMNTHLQQAMEMAEQEYRSLKEFTENASHETQTPLAIIRMQLDLMSQEENLSRPHSMMLKKAYTAVQRLSTLNKSLLLLSKIENHQFLQKEWIDLEKTLLTKINEFSEFWIFTDLKLTPDISDAIITANPELIDILLTNLLSNAGKHNHEGGKIYIKLSPRKLVVANTGQSSPLDKKRLYRRFYKESQQSKNNGLGLSIIKQICDESGISIDYVFSEPMHIFTMTWK